MITKLQKTIKKHIRRHQIKNAKIYDFINHTHHNLIHGGELIVLLVIFVSSFISAGFTGTQVLTDHSIVAQNLIKAQEKGSPGSKDSKIISMWKLDGSVSNSFYPGYCTYGAARISPEFFPYTDSKTQQRTRGGNAVDRCENAKEAGFSIGSKPSVGSLIVYSKIGNSGIFGHVGKVMYVNSSQKTIIVRDMNRTEKYMMTDRRESTEAQNIKCYIYPSKTTSSNNTTDNTIIIPNISTPIHTGSSITINTGTTINIPSNKPTNNIKTGSTIPDNTPIADDMPIIIEKPTPNPTPQPTTEPEINNPITYSNINLNFDNISDIAKHFITQYKISAQISQTNLKIGETAILAITINNLKDNSNYLGLIDNTPFEFISSNNNIKTDYSIIKLVNKDQINIQVSALQQGNNTLLINFGGETIGKINFSVN